MEFEEKFTLHFATINTDKVFQMEKLKGYLHYTLLLLILVIYKFLELHFKYLQYRKQEVLKVLKILHFCLPLVC